MFQNMTYPAVHGNSVRPTPIRNKETTAPSRTLQVSDVKLVPTAVTSRALAPGRPCRSSLISATVPNALARRGGTNVASQKRRSDKMSYFLRFVTNRL